MAKVKLVRINGKIEYITGQKYCSLIEQNIPVEVLETLEV